MIRETNITELTKQFSIKIPPFNYICEVYNLVKHTISLQIQFKTDIYGTFRQSVVFDFGSAPMLVRQLCVDSGPISDIDKLQQDLILTETGRWDISTKTVIQFEPRFVLFNYLEKHHPTPSCV